MDEVVPFVSQSAQQTVYGVPTRVSQGARLSSLEEYKSLWKESVTEPDSFFQKMAKEHLSWFKEFSKVRSGSFEKGDIAWFLDGKLNASYNCLDRHLPARANQIAIIWEGDEATDVRKVTYQEAYEEVCRLANALKVAGVRKGDTVAIYMPNCPECAYAMLAVTRIGAIHSVVFAGFSAESLSDRILDARSKVVITADEGIRGGKVIPLKKTVDEALSRCPGVEKVFVMKKSGNPVPMTEDRDVWLQEAMSQQRPYCPCEVMDSEDPLFFLYTSGSTGKPKGLVHTTAGYLLFASLTSKYTFDYREGDVYACVADVGWITGHTYIVYGPLCSGATTFMFESLPTYPNAGRYWDMVQRHKITQFYTAPTALRTLMKFGSDIVKKYDKSSLRILGTVGEPINPEAWKWYHEVVGESRCAIVDTYWQTESGGHLLTPIPGCVPLKPGSATFPFFGINPEVLDSLTGVPIKGNNVTGVLAISSPWPSIARTIYNDHQRYLNTYMNVYKGYYFTGDGVFRDSDGYYWISGRVDDVINCSGHRIGTAEVESALVQHPSCAEAAVVGIPDEVRGQAIFAYCTLKHGYEESSDLIQELKQEVRKHIGGFALPQAIVFAAALPKTRSGKIMRRILRKIATGDISTLGDITTLADPDCVALLIEKVKAATK